MASKQLIDPIKINGRICLMDIDLMSSEIDRDTEQEERNGWRLVGWGLRKLAKQPQEIPE